MFLIHGAGSFPWGPRNIGLNGPSKKKKSMDAVITEQSFGWNSSVCTFQEEMMNSL